MNLSEMYEGYNNLLRENNEYVAFKKPLVEMSNRKIVSGSKYIVYCCCFGQTRKRGGDIRKKEMIRNNR